MKFFKNRLQPMLATDDSGGDNPLLDIMGAGNAFLSSLNEVEANPEPASEEATQETDPGTEPQGGDPSNLQGNPEDKGFQPILENLGGDKPQPQVTPDNLESLKSDILSGLKDIIQPTQGEQPPAEQQEEPEKEIDPDEFMEKFSENPVQAIQELANAIADKKVAAEMGALTQKLAPVLKQSEDIENRNKVAQTISDFLSSNEFEDADQYYQPMVDYINGKGLSPNDVSSYREAYHAAKSNTLSTNKPLEQYLSDDESVSKIIQDPKIKDQIIAEYLQGIAQGNKPTVITNGNPAATPKTEVNSFKDAGNALLNSL